MTPALLKQTTYSVMGSPGYVYVLVNSSMPGLVKVGLTERDAQGRAAELSGTTGVPTPFVVAFEQYFTDCQAAEKSIHAELERRGVRVAPNREFFSCTANEVVRLIMNTPGRSSPSEMRVNASTVQCRYCKVVMPSGVAQCSECGAETPT